MLLSVACFSFSFLSGSSANADPPYCPLGTQASPYGFQCVSGSCVKRNCAWEGYIMNSSCTQLLPSGCSLGPQCKMGACS
ncbi:hypothetical protein OV203_45995 [Nannocystis sp. ILAH1]|uniref:hypothetical protein n=1 Tax=unclassified Nannocystis TaxID=2627009 RepID=UPI002271A2C9|nr:MULTISPECIES: hypothetical protein [unclassified Nannocystis]MCY0994564.1 hypothetical protein [Nannocystis sp. ILAH1]MCY1063168.1 hypothetical protein [Nannocystis sp. RBIL2]